MAALVLIRSGRSVTPEREKEIRDLVADLPEYLHPGRWYENAARDLLAALDELRSIKPTSEDWARWAEAHLDPSDAEVFLRHARGTKSGAA